MDELELEREGEKYRDYLLDGGTTARGEEATESFFLGISPRQYLLIRGWREIGREEDGKEALWEGWIEQDFRHPIYSTGHDLKDALLIQLRQEVERMGGFEKFVVLIDQHAVPADEMPC